MGHAAAVSVLMDALESRCEWEQAQPASDFGQKSMIVPLPENSNAQQSRSIASSMCRALVARAI
jgi:hypothetical protein